MSQEANSSLTEKTQKLQELIFNVMKIISFSLQKYISMTASSNVEVPNPAVIHSNLMNCAMQLDHLLTRFFYTCDQLEMNIKLRMEEIKYKSIVGEILSIPAMKTATYSQDYVDEMKSHVDHVKHLQDLLSDFLKN